MSTQRKFNYSFRNRGLRKVPGSQTETGDQPNTPSQIPASEETPKDSLSPKDSPSFPSDCENGNSRSQNLPSLDQPITAAELEHQQDTIRGI